MRDLTVTIPAGGAKSVPVNLSNYLLLKAGGPVDVVINGARSAMADRDAIEQNEFDRVIVENPSGVQATVVITVGRGDYRRW